MSEQEFHDVARVLEREALASGDRGEQKALDQAARIMRKRADVAAEIRALERGRRGRKA